MKKIHPFELICSDLRPFWISFAKTVNLDLCDLASERFSSQCTIRIVILIIKP